MPRIISNDDGLGLGPILGIAIAGAVVLGAAVFVIMKMNAKREDENIIRGNTQDNYDYRRGSAPIRERPVSSPVGAEAAHDIDNEPTQYEMRGNPAASEEEARLA